MLLESPLLPVEDVIRHVLLHHLVVGVKQHVAGRAGSRPLCVVHCKRSQDDARQDKSNKSDSLIVVTALTFIIGKLEVVIHGGYEFLHEEPANAGSQVLLAFHFTFQRVDIEI